MALEHQTIKDCITCRRSAGSAATFTSAEFESFTRDVAARIIQHHWRAHRRGQQSMSAAAPHSADSGQLPETALRECSATALPSSKPADASNISAGLEHAARCSSPALSDGMQMERLHFVEQQSAGPFSQSALPLPASPGADEAMPDGATRPQIVLISEDASQPLPAAEGALLDSTAIAAKPIQQPRAVLHNSSHTADNGQALPDDVRVSAADVIKPDARSEAQRNEMPGSSADTHDQTFQGNGACRSHQEASLSGASQPAAAAAKGQDHDALILKTLAGPSFSDSGSSSQQAADRGILDSLPLTETSGEEGKALPQQAADSATGPHRTEPRSSRFARPSNKNSAASCTSDAGLSITSEIVAQIMQEQAGSVLLTQSLDACISGKDALQQEGWRAPKAKKRPPKADSSPGRNTLRKRSPRQQLPTSHVTDAPSSPGHVDPPRKRQNRFDTAPPITSFQEEVWPMRQPGQAAGPLQPAFVDGLVPPGPHLGMQYQPQMGAAQFTPAQSGLAQPVQPSAQQPLEGLKAQPPTSGATVTAAPAAAAGSANTGPNDKMKDIMSFLDAVEAQV